MYIASMLYPYCIHYTFVTHLFCLLHGLAISRPRRGGHRLGGLSSRQRSRCRLRTQRGCFDPWILGPVFDPHLTNKHDELMLKNNSVPKSLPHKKGKVMGSVVCQRSMNFGGKLQHLKLLPVDDDRLMEEVLFLFFF